MLALMIHHILIVVGGSVQLHQIREKVIHSSCDFNLQALVFSLPAKDDAGGCKQRANTAIWRIMCPLKFGKQRKNQHAGCYQKWLWYRRPSDLWCLSPRYLKPSQPMAWVCVAALHHFKPCAVFHHLPTIVSGSERSGLCTLLWRSPTK